MLLSLNRVQRTQAHANHTANRPLRRGRTAVRNRGSGAHGTLHGTPRRTLALSNTTALPRLPCSSHARRFGFRALVPCGFGCRPCRRIRELERRALSFLTLTVISNLCCLRCCGWALLVGRLRFAVLLWRRLARRGGGGRGSVGPGLALNCDRLGRRRGDFGVCHLRRILLEARFFWRQRR